MAASQIGIAAMGQVARSEDQGAMDLYYRNGYPMSTLVLSQTGIFSQILTMQLTQDAPVLFPICLLQLDTVWEFTRYPFLCLVCCFETCILVVQALQTCGPYRMSVPP